VKLLALISFTKRLMVQSLPLLLKRIKLEQLLKLKTQVLISQVSANFTKVNKTQKSQSLLLKLKKEKLKLKYLVVFLRKNKSLRSLSLLLKQKKEKLKLRF